MKRILLVLIPVLLSFYISNCIFVYLYQQRLMFFPWKGASPPPADLNIQEVHPVTSDSIKLHAWWLMADSVKPTILFFHGNAGNISRGVKRMYFFKNMGFNVFAPDYRGYGISEGSVEKESDLYADALASWCFLTDSLNVPEQKIIIWGWSLGGAVAADLASRVECKALVMESTFTNMVDMASRVLWMLPYKILIRFPFRSDLRLAEVSEPVLFFHSRLDKVVPFGQGQKLHQQHQGRSKFVETDGSHNSGIFLYPDSIRTALLKFIGK